MTNQYILTDSFEGQLNKIKPRQMVIAADIIALKDKYCFDKDVVKAAVEEFLPCYCEEMEGGQPCLTCKFKKRLGLPIIVK